MNFFSCLDKSFQNVNNTRRFQLVSSSIDLTRGAMHVHPDIGARSFKVCCAGKALSTTYSERVSVALVIQHAKRVRRITFSAVVCPVLSCFPTLPHKRHSFRGKGVMNIKCVFRSSLQYLLEKFLILRKIQRDINVLCVHVQYSFHILMKPEFSRHILEKSTNIKFHDNPSSGNRVVSCERTDRRDKSISRFSKFFERA
jgi:hypothetical protein